MGSFATIEADFQQYYGLDLEKSLAHGFRRCSRLLINLPSESRFCVNNIDSKDWTWDKEVQSRILSQLDLISCQLANMTRKKGKKAIKPAEQFQPEYVKKAKEKAIEAEKKQKMTEEEVQELKDFWRHYNSDARTYGD